MPDKGENLSRKMIDLLDAFEDFDQAAFYRKGDAEWAHFLAALDRVNAVVKAMDSAR